MSVLVVSENKFIVQGEDKIKRSAQANVERNGQRFERKTDRFRSPGEHSRSGGEHSPVRAHTLTRSRIWARRNHKTLTNLWRSSRLWRWVLLSIVCTFSLSSLLWPGLGANACVEGMLPPCSCLCDRSDKRRKDTNTSEFDKEKTKRGAISTINGCLVADKLSFRSFEVRSCEIANVTADAVNLLFTCNWPCADRTCLAALKQLQWRPFQHRSSTARIKHSMERCSRAMQGNRPWLA